MSIKELTIFKGYTVDTRLRQFRKINKRKFEFIDFNSKKGRELLLDYEKTKL